jgi:Fanconi-associated nuclease 1
VPGAFESAFQTAPLDLCEDTFFPARQDAIVRRLAEIKAGRARALQLVNTHDAEYRARKVAAVGVRWDLCERKDLVGVVQVRG